MINVGKAPPEKDKVIDDNLLFLAYGRILLKMFLHGLLSTSVKMIPK